MNKNVAKELKIYAEQIAKRFSMPNREGNYNKELFILNYSLISHCKKKSYFCIDLGKNLVGKKEYWWDGIHTTPLGSQVISNIIFPDLKSFIN